MLYQLFKYLSFPSRCSLLCLFVVFGVSACSSSSNSNDGDSDNIFSLANYPIVMPSDSLTGLWVGVAEFDETVLVTSPALGSGIFRASHVRERRIFSVSPTEPGYEIYETQQFMDMVDPGALPIVGSDVTSTYFDFYTLFRDPVALTTEPEEIDAAGFDVAIANSSSLVLSKLRESGNIPYRLKKVADTPVDTENPSSAIGTIRFEIERSLDGSIVDTVTITAPIYSVLIQQRTDRYHYGDGSPASAMGVRYEDSKTELIAFYFDGGEFGPYMLVDEPLYQIMRIMAYGTSVLLIEKGQSASGSFLRIDNETEHNGEILHYSLEPTALLLNVRYQAPNPFMSIYGSISNPATLLQFLFGTGEDTFHLDYVNQITASVDINF